MLILGSVEESKDRPRAPNLKSCAGSHAALQIKCEVVEALGGEVSGFTFIRPYLETSGGLDATAIAAVLLTLGLASLAGSAIAGVFADRMLRDGFGATFLVLAIATVGLLTLNSAYVAILVFAATWGICRIRRAWPTRVR